MCLIIAKPAEASVELSDLEQAWEENSHGGGFAYAADGKLTVVKTLTKTIFMGAIQSALTSYPRAPFVIHTRIATHGLKNLRNVHPFYVNDNLIVAHNGVIQINVPTGATFSDTVLFNEAWLRNRPEGFLYDEEELDYIKLLIGSSKLAFLDNTGNIQIINDDLGEWFEGVWYSNTYTKILKSKPAGEVVELHKSKYCPNFCNSEEEVKALDSIVGVWANASDKQLCNEMTAEEFEEFCDELLLENTIEVND